jgi:hypothetical protein
MACEFKKYNYDTMIPCSHLQHKLSLLTSIGDITESFQEMKYFPNSEERSSKKFYLSSKNESFPPTLSTVNIPGYVIFNGKIERSLRSSVRKNSLTKIPISPLKINEEKKRKKSVTFSNSHYIRFIDNRFTILSENDLNELWYNAVDFMNIRISAELEAHYFKLENPQIINDRFFLKRLWSGTNYDEYKNNIIINSITTFCSKTQRITKTPP